MIRSTSVLLTILLVHFTLYPQATPPVKSVNVKFTVITHTAMKDSTVRITGNQPDLSNWWPTGVKLKKTDDSTWSKTFQFNTGLTIEYKFNLGSWETEALKPDGSIPPNAVITIHGDTDVVTHVTGWKKPDINKAPGKITGTVKYFRNLKGKGIRPRDVIVWLPPSYTRETKKRYPVLYMQDGQNLFDPSSSFTGVDWQLDEAADSLIRAGVIEEIIIVGIYNTSDRTKEYSDTKLGRSYMNFVVNTLKPFIEKRFRVLRGREHTAVGGSSMGGLISLMLAWNYPKIFSEAACLSPAFHVQDIDYVSVIQRYDGPKLPLRIYADVGTRELDSLLEPGTREMVDLLKEKVEDPEKNIELYITEGAAHTESAWAERNWRYLEFFFGKK